MEVRPTVGTVTGGRNPMKSRVILVAVLLGLMLVQAPLATEKEFGGGGIVYGEGYAFLLEAPKGWVLDTRSGVPDGLQAVFYPRGSSWSNSPTVMYAAWANKKKEGVTTLQQIIDKDVVRFKKDDPAMVITEGRPLKTGDGKTALVRLFKGDQGGNFEAVAYVDEKAGVAVLVLTCRKQTAFNKALPAFEKLVSSYHFYTEDVKVQKKAR
jgi:hypothetical protein